MLFRPANRADVPAIVALLADDVLGRGREADDPAAYFAAFDAIAAEPDNHLIVAEHEGLVVACCQLTFITGLALWHGEPSQARAIIGVGFCGGYTTFSTASVETVRLLQRGRYWAGLGNAFGTLAVTVAAAAGGLALASL